MSETYMNIKEAMHHLLAGGSITEKNIVDEMYIKFDESNQIFYYDQKTNKKKHNAGLFLPNGWIKYVPKTTYDDLSPGDIFVFVGLAVKRVKINDCLMSYTTSSGTLTTRCVGPNEGEMPVTVISKAGRE